MLNTYAILKFLHVSAVTIWVGGVFALVVLNGRSGRAGDGAAMRALAAQSEWFGKLVLGPAGLTTLVTGIVLAVLLKGGMTLWMMWGLAGVVLSIVIGAAFQGRAARRLRELAESGERGPALAATQRRVVVLAVANLAILFSTIAAMVVKPV